MANIPTPEIAMGIDVGADSNRTRDDFHSGPYLNVNDYSSVREALRDSARGNGAAYIPSGTTISVNPRVLISSAENGATLVGDGPDSVLRVNDWTGLMIKDTSAAVRNVHLANFRINANGNDYCIFAQDNGHDDEGVLVENLWLHNVRNAGTRIDIPGFTHKNCSAWNSDRHGLGGNNESPNDTPRTKFVQCLAWDCSVYGIDASSGSFVVDKCLLTRNGTSNKAGGFKTSTNTNHTTIRDTVTINNNHRGFQMTGAAQNLEIDNLLVRDNSEHGVVFSNPSNVNVGTLYTINNGKSNVFIYDDVTIEADCIEACGAANHGIQIESSGGSGYIDTVIASGNDGTDVQSCSIDINNVEQTSCRVPTVEEVLSPDSPTVRYRGADGWQEASVKYYDGEQFDEVSVNEVGSS